MLRLLGKLAGIALLSGEKSRETAAGSPMGPTDQVKHSVELKHVAVAPGAILIIQTVTSHMFGNLSKNTGARSRSLDILNDWAKHALAMKQFIAISGKIKPPVEYSGPTYGAPKNNGVNAIDPMTAEGASQTNAISQNARPASNLDVTKDIGRSIPSWVKVPPIVSSPSSNEKLASWRLAN